jgi:hypothetical protein
MILRALIESPIVGKSREVCSWLARIMVIYAEIPLVNNGTSSSQDLVVVVVVLKLHTKVCYLGPGQNRDVVK